MSKFSIKHSHQALAFREVRQFFLLAQSFYRPKTKTSFKRQFSPKSPKVGQKSGQRVQNWPNKNQVASDLLRESTDSVIRAAEGIHQFCPPTSQKRREISGWVQRVKWCLHIGQQMPCWQKVAEGLFWPCFACPKLGDAGRTHVDSLSRSVDRIDGFPQ